MTLNISKIRKDFPILNQKVNGKPLVYFDNAATTQKPQIMIDEIVRYYSEYNSNIHRGVHTLSQKATEAFEKTRELIAQIYNSKTTEVIFTKSDTESLNLLSNSLGSIILDNESNIVLSNLEHHSNIVPWQILKTKTQNNLEIRYASFDQYGFIDIEDLKSKIDSNTKIVSLNWCSNTFGIINPVDKIISLIKQINPEIIVILDAAQALPHKCFDFKKLNADFVTFSAHKLCGPTGVGVLIGKEDLLEKMPPFLGGGDMIRDVSWHETTYNDLPYKFEAGTPNIADVIAFRSSLEYLNNIGFENIQTYERELVVYLLDELSRLSCVEVYGVERENGEWRMVDGREVSVELLDKSKIGLVSFNLKGIHAHDVGSILDEDGIAVRSGHHCTQLIIKKLQIPASVRASLYIYNTKEEIDLFIQSLIRAKNIFA